MADLLSTIERIVRAVVGDSKYFRQYPCTVQAQQGFGPLDLLPDDAEIAGPGGLQGVPIRHGLPGVEVEVEVGSKVLLGFEAGDPSRPYAALWSNATIKRISFDGGDKPIAREGDPVSWFFPPGMQIVGTVGPAPLVGTVITVTTPGVGVIDGGADGLLG